MKAWLARLCGHIGCWFVGKADELDTNWDAAPPKYRAWLGELDEELGPRNCPTWPNVPKAPHIEDPDEEVTVRKMRKCTPPPPAPKKRHVIYFDGEHRTRVTIPPGNWWGAWGGDS